MSEGGLGRDGQLAGGDTGSIIILSSLILPLQTPREHWGCDLAELAVLCADAKVGLQEAKLSWFHVCLAVSFLGACPKVFFFSLPYTVLLLLYHVLTSQPESIQGTHIF